jgi:hypothetical protein
MLLMNDTEKELALKLAAHPHFEWDTGMRARYLEPPDAGAVGWHLLDYYVDYTGKPVKYVVYDHNHMGIYEPDTMAGMCPDITDPATQGCLWAQLRKIEGWISFHTDVPKHEIAHGIAAPFCVQGASREAEGHTIGEALAKMLLMALDVYAEQVRLSNEVIDEDISDEEHRKSLEARMPSLERTAETIKRADELIAKYEKKDASEEDGT